MSSALKNEEEKKEIFDKEEELEEKCAKLAKLIVKSKHLVAFTGAGISTGAGVPDYRSGTNTKLKTGPGQWEKKAVGEKAIAKAGVHVRTINAIPTATHMSFVQLAKEGLLKFVISQNTDGLHKRSGLDPKKLAELHGNSNLERCLKCKRAYMRDYRARTAGAVHTHVTGRKCEDPACGAPLCDTIVNFGENLPEWELEEGFRQSQMADLHVCMGSSLRVTPAADMPVETTKHGGKLVIINLQRTPLDHLATLRIGGMCDDVIQRVMRHLDIQIPKFVLTRRVQFSVIKKVDLIQMYGVMKMKALTGKPSGTHKEEVKFELVEKMDKLKIEEKNEEETKEQDEEKYLLIVGLASDGLPFSLFPQITLKAPGTNIILKKEPFIYNVERELENENCKFEVVLNFQGHYKEPPLVIDIDIKDLLITSHVKYSMDYDPYTCKWIGIKQF